jgi:hypothetical protein
MKEYQVYAVDKNLKLCHAGVYKADELTIDGLLRYQREWESWRRKYLKDNPGEYPLRTGPWKATRIIAHELGKPELRMVIPIRKEANND